MIYKYKDSTGFTQRYFDHHIFNVTEFNRSTTDLLRTLYLKNGSSPTSFEQLKMQRAIQQIFDFCKDCNYKLVIDTAPYKEHAVGSVCCIHEDTIISKGHGYWQYPIAHLEYERSINKDPYERPTRTFKLQSLFFKWHDHPQNEYVIYVNYCLFDSYCSPEDYYNAQLKITQWDDNTYCV